MKAICLLFLNCPCLIFVFRRFFQWMRILGWQSETLSILCCSIVFWFTFLPGGSCQLSNHLFIYKMCLLNLKKCFYVSMISSQLILAYTDTIFSVSLGICWKSWICRVYSCHQIKKKFTHYFCSIFLWHPRLLPLPQLKSMKLQSPWYFQMGHR